MADTEISLYIDIYNWTTRLLTQLVPRTNQVGFDERTTLSVEPCKSIQISTNAFLNSSDVEVDEMGWITVISHSLLYMESHIRG